MTGAGYRIEAEYDSALRSSLGADAGRAWATRAAEDDERGLAFENELRCAPGQGYWQSEAGKTQTIAHARLDLSDGLSTGGSRGGELYE